MAPTVALTPPSLALRLARGLVSAGVPGAARLSGLLLPGHPSASRWWEGVVRRSDGLLFHADTRRHIERRIALYGIYEAHIGALIRRLLKPGDCAVDVGANIGAHAVALADAVGPGGAVIAYEPNPQAAADAERNLALNGFSTVTLRRAALGAEAGTVQLRIPRADSAEGANIGLASIAALDTPHDVVDVPLVVFDDEALPFERSRIRLVKMDVQGYEPQALIGMSALLSEVRPHILFEFEPWAVEKAGYSAAWMVDFLTARGYRLTDAEHEGRVLTAEILASGGSFEVLCSAEA